MQASWLERWSRPDRLDNSGKVVLKSHAHLFCVCGGRRPHCVRIHDHQHAQEDMTRNEERFKPWIKGVTCAGEENQIGGAKRWCQRGKGIQGYLDPLVPSNEQRCRAYLSACVLSVPLTGVEHTLHDCTNLGNCLWRFELKVPRVVRACCCANHHFDSVLMLCVCVCVCVCMHACAMYDRLGSS